VFACDWQGIPVIHDQLVPTSYKQAPLISQTSWDGAVKIECGQVGTGTDGSGDGYFFDINCLQISVGDRNASNLRTFCEMGVDPDSEVEIQSDSSTNCVIGDEDITAAGALFRSAFYQLNFSGTNVNSFNYVDYEAQAATTRFGWSNVANSSNPTYQNKGDGNTDNPSNDYHDNWKGLPHMVGDVKQPLNSYYFYFGIMPGRTAVDILNAKYFAKCEREVEQDFVIVGEVDDVTTSNGSDGSLDITIIGGVGPFTYVITSTSGTQIPDGTIVDNGNGEFTVLFNSLLGGTYNVSIQDSVGGISEATFVVGEPAGVYCTVSTLPETAFDAGNGKIIIGQFGGGSGSGYEIKVYHLGGGAVSGYGSFTPASIGQTISGLDDDTYVVTIQDSNGDECVKQVVVDGPQELTLSLAYTDPLCADSNTGTITSTITGGIQPYITNTISNVTFAESPSLQNFTALPNGNYSMTVTDSAGTTATANAVLTDPSKPTLLPYTNKPHSYGCWVGSTKTFHFKFGIDYGAGAPYKIHIVNTVNNSVITHTNISAGIQTITETNIPFAKYRLIGEDKNGCTTLQTPIYNMEADNGYNSPHPLAQTNPLFPEDPLSISTSQYTVNCPSGGAPGAVVITVTFPLYGEINNFELCITLLTIGVGWSPLNRTLLNGSTGSSCALKMLNSFVPIISPSSVWVRHTLKNEFIICSISSFLLPAFDTITKFSVLFVSDTVFITLLGFFHTLTFLMP
jgi:hypothetical protein